MPVKECSAGGKSGFQYGKTGTCYTHDGSDTGKAAAKKKAVRQAIAIGGGTAPKGLSDRDLADAKMKTCKQCQKPRPVARFPEDKRTSDGLSGTCVTCRFPNSNSDRSFAAELETVDMDGVELLAAGGPYFGTGSPEEGDFFDEKFLKTLAQNAETLRDEVQPPIKIGHSQGQKLLKNSGLFTDEMPAAGYIENQRVANGKLLGDLKKVPKKIADLIDVGAFRKRSVEMQVVKSQTDDGKEYEVISALALLGAKAPAVRTLNDIVTAWYSDAEDDERTHMEETVRLLLADVENDTGARTVDFADGDVIWDGESGSQDWQQDLAAKLNANVTPAPGSTESPQPYYVQDIDQVSRKAIVCDWRDNTYWVVQFTLDQDGDPVPAPYEQWTLAEQAWVEASGDAATANASAGQELAERTQDSDGVRDTRNVSDSATQTEQKPEYSDEQISSFAEGFGIDESDAAKRRAAVEAKFAELSPKKAEEKPETKKDDETSAPAAAEGVVLSQEEKDKLLSDAKESREFMENMHASRITANLELAHRMGKIEAADFDHWRSFSERDYELATEALTKLPVDPTKFKTFGSDETGDERENKNEEAYRAYAAATQVPVVERKKVEA